jgi:hypothetical protein
MNVFIVKDNDIIFDYDELKLLPTIIDLYNRDKNTEKKYFKQELIYIWYICNFNSPGIRNGYNEARLKKEAVLFAKFQIDYRPDTLVNRAIKEYSEYCGGASVKYAQSLLTALNHSQEAINIISDRMSADLDEIKQLVKSADPEDKLRARTNMKGVLSDIEEIQRLSNSAPKAVENVKKALEVALDDLSKKDQKVWGNRDLGSREA